MNRRRFLQLTGLTAGALCLNPSPELFAKEPATAPAGPFSFVLLGDMHFARPAHYDPATMNDYARKVCGLTEAAWDGIWDEVKTQIRQAEPKPSFVVQVGDYVHGDCPTPEKSLAHYEDFVRSMGRHALQVPLFLARGNHELQGKGVRAAYDAQMPAYLRNVAPPSNGRAYYSFDAGPTAHITVLDVYGKGGRGGSMDAAQVAWMEEDLAAFRKRSPEGMALVVSHAPLFPMAPRGAVFDANPAAHADLLARLVRHRVSAVLCGHLHTVSTMTYADPATKHRLTQVMAYSMLGKDEVKAHAFKTPPYAADILGEADYRTPEDLAAMRKIVTTVSPNVAGFRQAQIPGYQVVRCDPAARAISVESFRGLGRRSFDVFKLPA
jgi:3',5'-cyclic AMP phosphodiesterase CpdA